MKHYVQRMENRVSKQTNSVIQETSYTYISSGWKLFAAGCDAVSNSVITIY